MKIIIEGDAKEIAALVVAIQERQSSSVDVADPATVIAEAMNQAMRENKKTMLIT